MNLVHYACLSAAIIAAGAAHGGEAIDETRDITGDGLINIEIANGIVRLEGWDRDQFHIAGELSNDAEGYDLREVNGGIRFEEEIDRPSRWGCWGWNGCTDDQNNLSILDIQVPRNSVLNIEGINVEIDLSGLRGNTEVEIINGEITLAGLSGIIKVETVNGSIEADDLDGRITLETVNGSIDDRNSAGDRIMLSTTNGSITSNTRATRVSAETVNGDIELELGSIDELELSSVAGRLEVATAMNERAQINISSVGGRVELSLPGDTSARFRLNTAVGGRIDNQLSDDEPVRENRYVNSSELNFAHNGGDGDVRISTVTGGIRLRAL